MGDNRMSMIASTENLFKLLSEVTGWGESITVQVSHSEVRRFTAKDETERTGRYTWVVQTTICGQDNTKVQAQSGVSYGDALYRLAEAVVARHEHLIRWHQDQLTIAKEKIVAFNQPGQPQPHPYR